MPDTNPDYNLSERVEDEFEVPTHDAWSVKTTTDSEIVWEHKVTLATVALEQTKPSGRDLPFRVTTESPPDTDDYDGQLYESDWLNDALHVAAIVLTAYANGQSDHAMLPGSGPR